MNAFLVLGICILLETIEQTVFSLSGRIPKQWMQWIGIGIAIHFVATLCWFWLLSLLPLGVAMPMMGGCYVSVCMVSWLLFKERISPLRWVGVMSIITGLILIGRSAV